MQRRPARIQRVGSLKGARHERGRLALPDLRHDPEPPGRMRCVLGRQRAVLLWQPQPGSLARRRSMQKLRVEIWRRAQIPGRTGGAAHSHAAAAEAPPAPASTRASLLFRGPRRCGRGAEARTLRGGTPAACSGREPTQGVSSHGVPHPARPCRTVSRRARRRRLDPFFRRRFLIAPCRPSRAGAKLAHLLPLLLCPHHNRVGADVAAHP